MGKALVIVESPAKIKTLRKFLGPNYVLESSVGHIRDLPEKEFGIDIERDFDPTYVVLPQKQEVIKRLQKAAKECDVVYLSPDPDREGEAIAWHITQILPPHTKYKRVAFNSITREAVLKALEQPRELDLSLVNAQQARRLLDRMVGYKISPLLNRRIQRGKENFLSAGRVQSVALKLVVEREKEIDVFKPVEYWNLGAILTLSPDSSPFRAALYSVDQRKVEKEPIAGKEVYLIPNQAAADAVLERMRPGPFQVLKVERKEKKRHPVPPFITSTLQQEASRHYGFSSSKTMMIAQGLYEGIELGQEGAEGLITYMRTDSVRIAPEAAQEARTYIQSTYGDPFLPSEIRQYASKKSAQDAHEAIRPTHIQYTPDQVKPYLTREQFLLYQLIWRRFLSSQMTSALYDTLSADLSGGVGIVLRATGSVLRFPGFLIVYEEMRDDEEGEEGSRALPPLEEGQLLQLQDLFAEQAFTRPPPRYTEASLVKELEKSGVGRPSTYATIMNKIQHRAYTVKENGRLKPTPLGKVITDMLESHFQDIMNVGFTAQMEDYLEAVAENHQDWKALIRQFWHHFQPMLERASREAFVPKVMTDMSCPQCGEGKLQKVWARSKYFYGCARYPDCTYSAPVEEVAFDKSAYADTFDWEQLCPLCQGEMKVRHGRYGPFLGCLRYPTCKGIINIPKKGEAVAPMTALPPCPAIGCTGQIVSRRSRFGKIFYSCSTFPDCDVIVNSLEEIPIKYADHSRHPFQREEKKGRTITKRTSTPSKERSSSPKSRGSRHMPLYQLSPQLAAVVGESALPRGEVVKRVWAYIKTHQLQHPQRRRIICPDALLGAVLGTEELDMMEMGERLNAHLNS